MNPYFEIKLDPTIDQFLWIFPVIFLIAMAIKFTVVTDIIFEYTKATRGTIIVTSILITLVSFVVTWFEYRNHQNIRKLIDNKEYEVVSGCIKNYIIDKAKRNKTFEIEEVQFSYNNYTTTPFFHERSFEGSFIKNGNCFSISYLLYRGQNKIIKIDQTTNI